MVAAINTEEKRKYDFLKQKYMWKHVTGFSRSAGSLVAPLCKTLLPDRVARAPGTQVAADRVAWEECLNVRRLEVLPDERVGFACACPWPP